MRPNFEDDSRVEWLDTYRYSAHISIKWSWGLIPGEPKERKEMDGSVSEFRCRNSTSWDLDYSWPFCTL